MRSQCSNKRILWHTLAFVSLMWKFPLRTRAFLSYRSCFHRTNVARSRYAVSRIPSLRVPDCWQSFLYQKVNHRYTASHSFSTIDDSASDAAAHSQEDTIYALSSGTATGQATAVAVIRLTGTQAGSILQQLTQNKPLPKPRMATLRKLYDPASNQPLDHALVLYFQQPSSFTGEDVVEFHCHGSRAVVQSVMEALSNCGARLAEAGEFTQRAWLAGKFDVLQIEALADLLTADTGLQRQQALQQLDGKLSQVYQEWRSTLIGGLAHAEAVIDFGDDERLDDDMLDEEDQQEVQTNVWGGVVDKMQGLKAMMERQLQDARRGELVREGLQIAIVGPPNAGKSSLFNLLSDRDAAIVSPTAGTTRDVLEVTLNLGGVKCILQDTAGVRTATDDLIELEGMKRAEMAAAKADLVVAMVDSTEANVGLSILEGVLQNVTDLDPTNILLVLNKSDLQLSSKNGVDLSSSTLQKIGGTFEISCETQQGVDSFLQSLTSKVVSRVAAVDDDVMSTVEHSEGTLITRARHRQHVQAAVEALERFEMLSQQGTMAVDMAAEELRLAASELGRITGAVDVEDVLDKLFSDFCIGK